MFRLALLLYVLFLVGYAAFTAAILHHVRKYSAPGKEGRVYTRMFVAMTVALAFLSFMAFLKVPWNDLGFNVQL
ncbi:MAG: hypothetical protein A3C80_04160 [Candidatus Ryanbacteria bacterium RIFCSPHIGHO2_02_FULL_45_43]|uniref:DUF1146 domain-containing protein n=1 Tax=Candidatus Ryanbacteria bacterium RIFCSPHIGHO2_01_45_13 TaxID=1802112 RepID=A0A1G2FXL7_9BACT|nr:MAG: hypothetical protein A2718_00190 [Candidatus Ryanbacteria bacterium RIFCSPHIGHO2_01_FULL_44_130]OGZ42824.1 MAG: hypothetical protein A2W41_00720 [Candidatus Ryanbacteria bacterium RIFCSPHIGHO2_01_45_13]OGZ48230.1 MAG: hypothetical protein A3C80_04160 [Candidatus Ryanbacteria bacterium RIFCSPHIGHO2_02_FULL_45_43]OGZ50006.1 MAG: hypothetical protein A3E55_01820 [Candidatus Ryanbacteria bacterium RIFCSPHIGHO2_12_FULL_44_20]OGZ51465.1 MAG: hypothetical protein A3A17_01770 [Candidatus Ryanba